MHQYRIQMVSFTKRDPVSSSAVTGDSWYLIGSTNIDNTLTQNMYVPQKVQNHSVVLKTFSYSVEILAMVSQELYSTPVKISLHCAVRTPLSQSPVVRKVVMSTLLWSRRRFDGLQEKKHHRKRDQESADLLEVKFDINISRNFQTSRVVPVCLWNLSAMKTSSVGMGNLQEYCGIILSRRFFSPLTTAF